MTRVLFGLALGQVVFLLAWFFRPPHGPAAFSLCVLAFLAFHFFVTGLARVLRENG